MKEATVTVPIDMGKDLEPLDLSRCGHENLHFNLEVTRVCHEEGEDPHTLELENKTVQLTGTVQEQYAKLRTILRDAYYEDLGVPVPGS